jgi:hypothetical protein
MKMKLFATLDKAKPDTENIRGLNLAAVTCTTVQVSIDCQCSVSYWQLGHNLLYRAWTERCLVLVYIVYTYILEQYHR